MKCALRALALIVAGVGLGRAAEAPAAKPTLATIAWLAGSWSFERNGRVVEEQWLAPAGGTMLGMGRTVTNGQTSDYEFVVLQADVKGDIVYSVTASKQPAASFTLKRASEFEAVFENLEQKFPQRILYTLQPDGSLLAAIEGTQDGKGRRVLFPYRRVKS